ncbi:MAG: hypothetical protein HY904_12055 [Deltaproteobacteria bacterium]|nr:hypothetical protein [Deltaproteobacteria bacterium]
MWKPLVLAALAGCGPWQQHVEADHGASARRSLPVLALGPGGVTSVVDLADGDPQRLPPGRVLAFHPEWDLLVLSEAHGVSVRRISNVTDLRHFALPPGHHAGVALYRPATRDVVIAELAAEHGPWIRTLSPDASEPGPAFQVHDGAEQGPVVVSVEPWDDDRVVVQVLFRRPNEDGHAARFLLLSTGSGAYATLFESPEGESWDVNWNRNVVGRALVFGTSGGCSTPDRVYVVTEEVQRVLEGRVLMPPFVTVMWQAQPFRRSDPLVFLSTAGDLHALTPGHEPLLSQPVHLGRVPVLAATSQDVALVEFMEADQITFAWVRWSTGERHAVTAVELPRGGNPQMLLPWWVSDDGTYAELRYFGDQGDYRLGGIVVDLARNRQVLRIAPYGMIGPDLVAGSTDLSAQLNDWSPARAYRLGPGGATMALKPLDAGDRSRRLTQWPPRF